MVEKIGIYKMVLNEEIMFQIELYSVNNESEVIYSGDVPKNHLERIKKINEEYKQAMMEEFVKILPGKEMIDGKPITKKQLGKFFVCYVDRVPKEEVEKMKEYDRKMREESKYLKDFKFVTFVNG